MANIIGGGDPRILPPGFHGDPRILPPGMHGDPGPFLYGDPPNIPQITGPGLHGEPPPTPPLPPGPRLYGDPPGGDSVRIGDPQGGGTPQLGTPPVVNYPVMVDNLRQALIRRVGGGGQNSGGQGGRGITGDPRMGMPNMNSGFAERLLRNRNTRRVKF